MERLSRRDLESLISRLSEPIYAYCDVGGFKTRLIPALFIHDDLPVVMEERLSALWQQSLESFGLTPREIEILHLVTQGKTNKELAAGLYFSPLTESTHLEHVYQKLGVGIRTEAVAFVLGASELSASVPE